jgi:trigger factor
MQITETMAEGLKRQYKIVVPAGDLAKRMEDELVSLQKRANIPGFRPGKVPQQHLKRVYGKSVMADVVQNAVNEVNKKIVDDNGLKLAFEPAVNFPQDQGKIEAVMDAKSDLEYTVSLEVLPKFDIADHGDISLEKQVAEVPDADVVAAIERMAEPSIPTRVPRRRRTRATASQWISSVASTASSLTAARAMTSRLCWAPTASSLVSRIRSLA